MIVNSTSLSETLPASADVGVDQCHLAHTDWHAIGPSDHLVQFYDTDEVLLDSVAAYLAVGLLGSDSCGVIATPTHLDGIEERLRAAQIDVDDATARGQFIRADARETLARFMVHGEPNPVRFVQTIDAIYMQAAQAGQGVRFFGEMVALLALEGHHSAAVRLEELWNELQQIRPFSLFCAYPMACMTGPTLSGSLSDVCATHSRVNSSGKLQALPTLDARHRAVVQWEQKARALEDALAAELAARQAAEDALRIREEFLSIASHELKTPLTTLLGHTQIALRQIERDVQFEPERVQKSLQTIKAQGDKLSRLISLLLDATRLDTGKFVINRATHDLAELVRHVVATVYSLGTRHIIALDVPRTLDVAVDPMRIEQVVTNLLDNAMKFSPEGSKITVAVSLDEPDGVILSVRDHGPGVPAELREQLFERFYQVNTAAHQRGLGSRAVYQSADRRAARWHD